MGPDHSRFITVDLEFQSLAQKSFDRAQHPFPCPFGMDVNVAVSSLGESHPQALSEPYVNLSIHPAPIIQPMAKSPSASARTVAVLFGQFAPTNVPRAVDGDSAFCISYVPNGSEHDSCV